MNARFRYENRLHYARALLALARAEPEPALGAADACLAAAAAHQAPKYEVRVDVDLSGTLTTGDVTTINGLSGADVINASALPAGVLALTLDGGADADLLIGSQGDGFSQPRTGPGKSGGYDARQRI